MAYKDPEKQKEYMKKYYKEKIKDDKEARERKNARQREYAKRTGYAANNKYEKENIKRYVIKVVVNTEQDIIERLESQDNKMGYIKKLIREDIEKNQKSLK